MTVSDLAKMSLSERREYARRMNQLTPEEIGKVLESLPTDVLETAVRFEGLASTERPECQHRPDRSRKNYRQLIRSLRVASSETPELPDAGDTWAHVDGGSVYVLKVTKTRVRIQRRPFGDPLAEPYWVMLYTFAKAHHQEDCACMIQWRAYLRLRWMNFKLWLLWVQNPW